MEHSLSKIKLLLCLSISLISSSHIESMDCSGSHHDKKTEVHKTRCGSFIQWTKEYGPSLVLSAAICAVANQLSVDENYLNLFSQHAFADTITHSLKNVGKVQIRDRSTLLKSIGHLLAKNTGLYTSWFIWEFLGENYLTNIYFGFSDALVMASFYTTASHFTNEEEAELKNNAELLEKILHDPKFTATCHELAKKTIEVVIHNPDIIAEQLNDPTLRRRLEAIKDNPELMEEYRHRSEAWLALQQELTMSDAAPASVPVPFVPVPASLDEDSGAGVAGAAAQEVLLDSTVADAAASAGSLPSGESDREKVHLEQLAEQLIGIFSQDPRFEELMLQTLGKNIRRRATAIAAATALQRSHVAVLEDVVSHDPVDQVAVRSTQKSRWERATGFLKGITFRGSKVGTTQEEEARQERSSSGWSLLVAGEERGGAGSPLTLISTNDAAAGAIMPAQLAGAGVGTGSPAAFVGDSDTRAVLSVTREEV